MIPDIMSLKVDIFLR